ncbi:hypothetical protein DU504_07260 [Haloplanus salinus]|uniref:Rhomboid family intramembrane serine protease n=1 Tax=Haloplanus salinus TaxID=1126245 RepID=A0A368NBZ4_9EURY|nr:hypothetical protein [Haloplanus salinus]RCU47115.1 hypothetical protein DU504_07260 [Haloplanus salinus]
MDGGVSVNERWDVPSPTASEAATVCSVPTVLLAVHFVVRPAVEAWPKLGYVRHPVAQAVAANRVAPESLVGVAGVWHGATRLTHALVHDPAVTAHALVNAVLVAAGGGLLLTVLATLGWRRWFVHFYWELIVVGPVVGSYAFDLFGQTAYGYGASTSAFAVFGALAVFGTVVLVEHRRLGRVAGGGAAALLACIGGAVGADIAAASPATAVHQAGFGFGVLVGVVGVALLWWRGEAVVAGVGAIRRSTASSEGP